MTDTRCEDPVVLDQWYAIAALPEIPLGVAQPTRLLGFPIAYGVRFEGDPVVWRVEPSGQPGSDALPESASWLPVRFDFGYLWTTLGQPEGLFAIPEVDEPDRVTLNAMTVGIAVSGPRAIENFLDMAHFPYVHAHILGEEPRTEVADYDVEMRDGEIWATGCEFYQPRASAASDAPALAQYEYRVPHPYCALLYKSAPHESERMDVIGIFAHPVDEENIRAHLFLSVLGNVNTQEQIRHFQQGVLAQDKPILENQLPKRLPLGPRAETPIRADKVSIAYRRWLQDLGVKYSVIAAPESGARQGKFNE